MNRRAVVVASLVVVLAAGVGAWWVLLRNDAPPPVSLEEAVAGVGSTTTAAPGAGTTTIATTGDATTAAPAGLDGTWTIDTTASFAGYRVQEELANIGATEAVGRTSQLTGGLTLSGNAITAVDVTVDMTTLVSNNERRDGALSQRGLETSVFPTASFALTEPIVLATVPAIGGSIEAVATGDLTVHGVTRNVAIPIAAQLVDGTTIVVVGSLDIALADYDIEPPTGFAVLSINEVGTIEMQLAFTR